MIRRTNRLRREFIYRKSLEGKERELYEKKRKIRECLEEGKAIPTELRNSEAELRKELALEDVETATNGAVADDELYRAKPGMDYEALAANENLLMAATDRAAITPDYSASPRRASRKYIRAGDGPRRPPRLVRRGGPDGRAGVGPGGGPRFSRRRYVIMCLCRYFCDIYQGHSRPLTASPTTCVPSEYRGTGHVFLQTGKHGKW